jgi:5-methylcytosine-specific restriction endonuclease McrA
VFLEVYPQVLGVSTLKRCSKCGEFKPLEDFSFQSSRNKHRAICKECDNARAAQYRAENPEQVKKANQSYYAKNKGKDNERSRAWHANNKSKVSEQKKLYYIANEDRIKERRAEKAGDPTLLERRRDRYQRNKNKINAARHIYYLNHPEKFQEQKRRRRERNPEKEHDLSKARSQRYRARKQSATGTFTTEDLRLIRASQTDKRNRLRCWYCGEPIEGSPHLDHKIPLSRGGTNGPENLCYSCGPCNLSKFTKTPAEYAGRLI